MIPKIIHYCWFGKGLMPKSQRDCIKGWRKLMPDYQIMRWDESNFDVNCCPYVKESYAKRKYAFVADVARLVALSEYGGIYLDTDVEVFQRFDRFLDLNFFSGVELYREFETEHIAEQYLFPDGTPRTKGVDVPRLEVLTSSMGCCAHAPLVMDILEYFKNLQVTGDMADDFRKYVNFDRLVARYLTHYGFRYKNETQYLENGMVVYGTGVFGYAFCPDAHYEVSYHHNASTWENEGWNRSQKASFFFDKLGLLPVYKGYKKIKKTIKRAVTGLFHPIQGEIWCLHRVLPQRSGYPSNRALEITPEFLEALILEYKKRKFSFVTIDALLGAGNGLCRRRTVNVSFDDGFRDVYANAFPILKKYSIPFTVYLTTDMPDGKADLWWLQMEKVLGVDDYERMLKEIYGSGAPMKDRMHDLTDTQPDLELCRQVSLSWDELKEMLDSGLCTLGSHSVSHPGLDRIGPQECVDELLESRKRIKEMLSVDAVHFSYPHSMKNEMVQKAVAEAGYVSAALGYGGSVRRGYDPYGLNRNCIIQK